MGQCASATEILHSNVTHGPGGLRGQDSIIGIFKILPLFLRLMLIRSFTESEPSAKAIETKGLVPSSTRLQEAD